MINRNLVARLTMTRRSGKKLIVEVHEDAGWSTFYHWFEVDVDSKKKMFLRNSDRNNSCNPLFETPGLEQVAALVTKTFDKLAAHPVPKHALYWSPSQIVDTQIKIYRKRLYKKLLGCAPDQLPGGGPVRIQSFESHTLPEPAGNIRITDEYRRMKERRSRIFGWAKEEAG